MARLPNGYASAPKRLLVLGSIRFVRPLNPPSRGLSCANTSDFAASFTILGDKGTHDRLFCRPFQRALKPGMDILRPPPGHQDDEAPPPRRNPFIRLVFAVLFLVIGMVVFFIGGLVVRNPELPNYVLDQIVRHFRGSANAGIRVNPVAKITPPPSPTTAEEYIDLLNYDENDLSPSERAIASILIQMVRYVLVGGPPTERFKQDIFPVLNNLKPGDDVSGMQTAVQECRDLVSKYVRHCQDGAVLVEAKLTGADLAPSMAHDVAVAFARRPLTNGTLYWPDEFNKACDDATAPSHRC